MVQPREFGSSLARGLYLYVDAADVYAEGAATVVGVNVSPPAFAPSLSGK